MDVFELRNSLIADYEGFVRSYLRVRDPRLAARVEGELGEGALWPDPLLQLNPAFEPGPTVDDLVDDGTLHPTCGSIFRRDKITKAIYRRVPAIVNQAAGDLGNPWGLSFSAMLHMSNDSGLFRSRKDLEATGWTLDGNRFVRGTEQYLPLYEAKMVHHYEYCFGDYAARPEGSESTVLPDVPFAQLADPAYQPQPRYWVAAAEVDARLEGRWSRLAPRLARHLSQRRRTYRHRVSDSAQGCRQQVPTRFGDRDSRIHLLIANLSALAFDYAARQKIGGTPMNYFIFKQLQVLPPAASELRCPWSVNETTGEWIKPRVLELTYTAHHLAPFARDLGYDGPPFPWNPDCRHHLRCELDAAFFHLYGLNRDDTAYILDTFPIVREKEEKQFGEYRTKRVVLELYDGMAQALDSTQHIPSPQA